MSHPLPRRLVVLLSSVVLSSLSCSVLSMAPPPELPPVSAPAPEGVQAPTAPDPAVAEVRADLETRRTRTGLIAEEMDVLAEVIVRESRRHGLEPNLVMAVMYVESRYRNFSVSPVGALGLMQVMPATGEELARQHDVLWRGPQTLFDPIVNVRLGTAYLAKLIARYEGDVATALAAYNWGPGHIDRRLARGRKLPEEYPGLVFEAHAIVEVEGRRS
ncbi:MAG: lytic transglycosylase domain-containing protein [Myxococcota bacterium]